MSKTEYSETALMRLPALTGSQVSFDPPADTPPHALLFCPDEYFKLLTLCARYKAVPPFALVGLHKVNVPYMGLRDYMKIRDLFSHSTDTLTEKNLLAYKAFLLFAHAGRVRAFHKKWGTVPESTSLKNLITNIPFPKPDLWPRVSFRAWGEAFYQHGIHKVMHPFVQASGFMSPVKTDGNVSLLRTNFALAARRFASNLKPEILKEITDLSVIFRLRTNEYKRALSTYAERIDPPHERHTLPEFYIDGERYGMPGTAFYALNRDDPTKLFLGYFTGCCEKISDDKHNIENTIQHSFQKTSSTFYIVCAGQDIIAHTWAWRGSDNSLCLDGFESKKDSRFTMEILDCLLEEISTEITNPEFKDFDLTGLFIGRCADRLEPARERFLTVDVNEIKPRTLAYLGMNRMDSDAKMALVL